MNPKIIARSENKFLNNSLSKILDKARDIKNIITNKNKFLKVKLIFLLLARTILTGLLTVLFLEILFTFFFLTIL